MGKIMTGYMDNWMLTVQRTGSNMSGSIAITEMAICGEKLDVWIAGYIWMERK